MKRKFLLPILSICMVVALVSVGFAAWLITGNDTTSANGQFVTYEVSNQYFSVKAEVSKDITFGKPKTVSTTTYKWFQFDDSVDGENLSTDVTLTLTPEDQNYLDSILKGGYELKVTLKAGAVNNGAFVANEDYDSAVFGGYLVLPTVKVRDNGIEFLENAKSSMKEGLTFELEINGTDFATSESESGASATYTFTINFGWGTFGGATNQNPYYYYNSSDNTQEYRQAAMNAMEAINKLKNYEISLEIFNSSESST